MKRAQLISHILRCTLQCYTDNVIPLHKIDILGYWGKGAIEELGEAIWVSH